MVKSRELVFRKDGWRRVKGRGKSTKDGENTGILLRRNLTSNQPAEAQKQNPKPNNSSGRKKY